MNSAIILHGMPDKEEYYDVNRPASSNCHWIPWIQKQLLLRDVVAQAPEMPVPYNPEYSAWKEMFERFPLDENTILIGHSCGAGFIVRYLSESDVKVGKVVLVAPWIDSTRRLDTGMFDFTLSADIVSKTKGITVFVSTDDDREILDTVAKITDTVKDVKVVTFTDKKHFCLQHMGTDAFPELLAEF